MARARNEGKWLAVYVNMADRNLPGTVAYHTNVWGGMTHSRVILFPDPQPSAWGQAFLDSDTTAKIRNWMHNQDRMASR